MGNCFVLSGCELRLALSGSRCNFIIEQLKLIFLENEKGQIQLCLYEEVAVTCTSQERGTFGHFANWGNTYFFERKQLCCGTRT